jgi:hypothetical protein
MNVLYFDQRQFCLACGHRKTNCTCNRSRLTPCRCNSAYNAGGWQGCTVCGGRGWIAKEAKA